MSDAKKKTIFVVDDDDTFLAQFDSALKSYYNVVTISSGKKMFSLLERISPHLIVLDIEMPEMDGFEVLRKLKADERYAHIPTMFLTGLQDTSIESKGIQMGVSDFIMKAYVSPPVLNNRIKLQLSAKALRERATQEKGAEIKRPELKTIVAVDDSETFLATFESAMKSYYNVVTVSSGEKLFPLLEKVTPTLIVCDIEMPDMTGFDVLTKLKTNRKYKHIPVMFLSGVQDSEMEMKGFRMGISDFIEKEFFSAPVLNNRIKLQLSLLEQEEYNKLQSKWK